MPVMQVTELRDGLRDLCTMKKWWIVGLALLLGALAGWAYWYWYGCTNGCAITGSWWTSSAYGAVMGYLTMGLVLPDRKAKEDPADKG